MDIEQIYTEYFGDVYRYILRMSGDVHTAEDVTCDAFFRAMRSIDSFRGDCDVRVWLCQIAKNLYFSHLKKQKRTVPIDEAAEISDNDALEDKISGACEAERIKAVLHGIPEPYKEVFMWRVYAELSFKQIAQIFGKTDNWACVTYHRARNMIRERLEGYENEK